MPSTTLSSTNDNQACATCLDEISKQNKIIRSRVRKCLQSMDPSFRSQQDNAMQSTVIEAPWFKSSQRLCACISCSSLNAVDTSRLVSEILQSPAAKIAK